MLVGFENESVTVAFAKLPDRIALVNLGSKSNEIMA
jgi:hypothetical protein